MGDKSAENRDEADCPFNCILLPEEKKNLCMMNEGNVYQCIMHIADHGLSTPPVKATTNCFDVLSVECVAFLLHRYYICQKVIKHLPGY